MWKIVIHSNHSPMVVTETNDASTKDTLVEMYKSHKDSIAIFIYHGDDIKEFIFLVA